MTTYRDLSIHQRVNAKANAQAMNWNYSVLAVRHHGARPINLIQRLEAKDMEQYRPDVPFYAITFKTNHHDPTPYETRY
jgi:hypothetical protein